MSLDLIYHECYVNSTVINTLFEFAINQSVLDVIGSIGAVTAALLYSTAIPTLIQFFRSRNTGNRYIWPFIVMFLNCSLWLLYGLPLISPAPCRWPLIASSAYGMVVNLVCMVTFCCFIRGGIKVRALYSSACAAAIVAMTVLYAVLLLSDAPRGYFSVGVGIAAAVLLGLTYLCALAAVVVVVKTRVMSLAPFWLSVGVGCNSIAWTAYGFYSGLLPILAPDLVGILLFLALALAFVATRRRKVEGPHALQLGDTTSREQSYDISAEPESMTPLSTRAATDRMFTKMQNQFGFLSPFSFPEMIKMSSILFASEHRSLPSLSMDGREDKEDEDSSSPGVSAATATAAPYGSSGGADSAYGATDARPYSKSCPFLSDHVQFSSLNASVAPPVTDFARTSTRLSTPAGAERVITL